MVAIVEHWNQWAHIKQDLYGFIDLVCIRPDRVGVMGVNPCGEDASIHIRKYMEGWTDPKGKFHEPNKCLPVWLKAGNPFFLWAWRKRGDRGKRKVWHLKQIEAILKDGKVEFHEIPDTTELQTNGD